MRAVADEAGIESATIYYHFANKQALLSDIMEGTIKDLTASAKAAIAEVEAPEHALRLFIANHAEFHGRHRAEAVIADAEIDALESELRGKVVRLRDDYEGILGSIVTAGISAGKFTTDDPEVTTKAILSMATGVAIWYREGRRIPLPRLADMYGSLALRMVGSKA